MQTEMKLTEFDVLVEDFFGNVDKIIESKDKISEQHSILDQSVSDILHSIEFGINNAVDLMKLSKRLKELLKERRDVKNNLRIIHMILENTKLDENRSMKLQSRVNRIADQSYRPRQLTDLNY